MSKNIKAAALLVEKVKGRGMDRDKFLGRSNVPKLRHRFLPSSEFLIWVFSEGGGLSCPSSSHYD
jgi:hypothetical protein